MAEEAETETLIQSTPEEAAPERPRSEEHTSELQSQSTISYAVFCLKKKKKDKKKIKKKQ